MMIFWVVKEGHPKPEKYIPVFELKDLNHRRFTNKENFKIFRSKKVALNYAQKVADQFSTSTIRIFYHQGHSEIYKSAR